MGIPVDASFQPTAEGRGGRRLHMYHAPAPGVAYQGAVLYVHPFADEMNKARRMAALQSRAFAAQGLAVLQPDLFGCGDSAGEFGQATWEDWVSDIAEAALHLHNRHPGPLWLWGLRAGALLAAAAAPRLPVRPRFLWWQPALAGRQVLQQFLRLKVAGDLLGSGGQKITVEALRKELADGRSVDVAGYELNPQLASGLEAAVIGPASVQTDRVEWFELQQQEAGDLSPAAARGADALRQAGIGVRTHTVVGPAFWQTTEIEDAPELLHATCGALTAQAGEGARLQPVAP